MGPRAGPDVSVNEKLWPLSGIEHRTVQPVTWSLHSLRHPGSKAFNNAPKQESPKRLCEANYERDREREIGRTTKAAGSGVQVKSRRAEIPRFNVHCTDIAYN